MPNVDKETALLNQIRGIPMGDLIGAPLNAAAAAQANLANVMIQFIEDFGLEGEGDGQKARSVQFIAERHVTKDDDPTVDSSGVGSEVEKVRVSVPVLGIIPIPALLIDQVDVNFTMNVSQHIKSDSTTSGSGSLKAKIGWGILSASISGSISTTKANTRATDYSAKYDVSVHASQQPQTEGMKRLLDAMADATYPRKEAS